MARLRYILMIGMSLDTDGYMYIGNIKLNDSTMTLMTMNYTCTTLHMTLLISIQPNFDIKYIIIMQTNKYTV